MALKEGEKTLQFSIEKKDDQLFVIIKDNGIGREKSAAIKNKKLLKRESYGMKLTEERLRSFVFYNKDYYNLEIKDLKDKMGHPLGTSVEIMLPIVVN